MKASPQQPDLHFPHLCSFILPTACASAKPAPTDSILPVARTSDTDHAASVPTLFTCACPLASDWPAYGLVTYTRYASIELHLL